MSKPRLWTLKLKKFFGAHLSPDDVDALVEATKARALGETPAQTRQLEALARKHEAEAKQHEAQADLLRTQALETPARTMREMDAPEILISDGTRVGYRNSETARIFTLLPTDAPLPFGLRAEEALSQVAEYVHSANLTPSVQLAPVQATMALPSPQPLDPPFGPN